MKKLFLFALFAFVSCAHAQSAYIIDEVKYQQKGGFTPGPDADVCYLYNLDGDLIVKIKIREHNRPHGNSEAFYVKCYDWHGKPVWPQETLAQICPFIGNTPECPLPGEGPVSVPK